MSLTNRILLAMAAGIALGSMLEWLLGVIDPAHGAHAFIQEGLVLGAFDVVGPKIIFDIIGRDRD